MPRVPIPLWLDLLRTPMAAPESATLRRMRRTWQALCGLSALLVGCFAPLHVALGAISSALAAAVLLATASYTCLYLLRKHAADTAFIAQAGEGE